MNTTIKLITFLLLIVVSEVARGDSREPIEAFTYRAPDACPDGQDIQRRVYALIRRDAPSSYDVISADIEIKQTGTTEWQLVLRTSQAGHQGERRLQADSCQTLTNTAALVMALMINPELNPDLAVDDAALAEANAALQPVEDVEGTASSLPPDPAAGQPADPQSDVKREHPLNLAPYLFVGGVVDLGTIASVSGGAVLGGGVQFGGISVDLEAIFLAPREQRVSESQPAGGQLWLIGGALTGAWAYSFTRTALGPYLQLEMAAVNGRGVGVDFAEEIWILHAAVGGGVEAQLTLGEHLRLKWLLGILIPLQRRRYVLDNIGEIHEIWPVLPRLAMNLEWRL